MLSEPPSKAQLTKTFQNVLDRILDGSYESAPDGNGLDSQTNAALNEVALARDGSRAAKIIAAHDEFLRQLDGTHLEQGEAAILKLLGP